MDGLNNSKDTFNTINRKTNIKQGKYVNSNYEERLA